MRLTHMLFGAAIGLAAIPVAAADAPAPATATEAPAEEKLICKSQTETGSLVKKRKTCLTKAQWQYTFERNNADAYKMREDLTGRPAGN